MSNHELWLKPYRYRTYRNIESEVTFIRVPPGRVAGTTINVSSVLGRRPENSAADSVASGHTLTWCWTRRLMPGQRPQPGESLWARRGCI